MIEIKLVIFLGLVTDPKIMFQLLFILHSKSSSWLRAGLQLMSESNLVMSRILFR